LLANDPNIEPYTKRGSVWNRDFFEFAQGVRFAVRESRGGIRYNPDVVGEAVADEFTAWRSATIAAEFDNLLRGSTGLPRQGILLRRIHHAIEELEKDFPAAPTRESYATRIAELKSAYEAKSRARHEAEMEELWRSENQRNPSSGSKDSK